MKVIPRDQHCISRKNISDGALKVMARLRSSDHQAYLVGGAVRDLLLGGHPKDFDIATDATPEEVHAIFRNSRIIGRRFRIVHVRFGREVIEVTTFRGHHDSEPASGRGKASHQSDQGLLLRDNVFGTLEEDAVRRDLTVNALYYDAANFAVYDHVHGMQDLEQRSVCIIGEPEVRFREDPVRMLRAARFAAKLEFTIEDETATAIPRCAHLLREIPSARLFDEFLKLFFSGYAERTLEQLMENDLLRYLFPDSDYEIRQDSVAMALVQAAMRSTDQRIQEGKPVTPAFLLAALLWPVTDRLAEQLRDRGDPPMTAMHNAAQQVIASALQTLSIPRRFSMPMREIWEFQLRLQRGNSRKARELLQNRRFRAAYDFLLLREQVGEETGDVGAFWTELQTLPENQNLPMLDSDSEEAGDGAGGRPRRRRPRKRRPATS
ncbi:polynucleotide adenylyltransferase PcnB [Haliea sp. E1-2-M8]|uniref:polynucleotide adenylyltransferase PcnB n=1 Tax=Haliea sp. E1-2-M8 TaxID=3064706 RepID=UPI00271FCC00|nr:polynucleotide adenylyltransferase PcnB [Haliea sp. E1-2-M8]MDO8861581.1 polynucleotide adenylyltransferase PcnB [Haliea sp. E1-2-M8]